MQLLWEQEIEHLTKNSTNLIKQAQNRLSELDRYISRDAGSHLLLDKAREAKDMLISLVVNLHKIVKFNQDKAHIANAGSALKPKETDAATIKDDGPRAYRVKDACARLGICNASFYKMMKSGKIKTINIGDRRLISVSEVERLLNEGSP